MNNEVNLKLLIVYIQNCLLKFESEVFQLNDMNTVKLGLQIVPLLVSPFLSFFFLGNFSVGRLPPNFQDNEQKLDDNILKLN